jgi:hypothetical protein
MYFVGFSEGLAMISVYRINYNNYSCLLYVPCSFVVYSRMIPSQYTQFGHIGCIKNAQEIFKNELFKSKPRKKDHKNICPERSEF